MRTFDARTLRCVGTVDGKPCPHAFEVDFADPEAKDKLEFLHLDHERPVHLTCARWAAQLVADGSLSSRWMLALADPGRNS